ncbi:hypothetical protein B0H13DRAFT_2050577, partial [Mycena leptocephala]
DGVAALRDEDGDGDKFAGEGRSGSLRRGCSSFGCVGGMEHQSQERCDAAMGKDMKESRRRRGAKRDLRTLLRPYCTSPNGFLPLCDRCPCVTCRASVRTRRAASITPALGASYPPPSFCARIPICHAHGAALFPTTRPARRGRGRGRRRGESWRGWGTGRMMEGEGREGMPFALRVRFCLSLFAAQTRA